MASFSYNSENDTTLKLDFPDTGPMPLRKLNAVNTEQQLRSLPNRDLDPRANSPKQSNNDLNETQKLMMRGSKIKGEQQIGRKMLMDHRSDSETSSLDLDSKPVEERKANKVATFYVN